MQQRPEQGRCSERPSCHPEPRSSPTRRAHCLPASPGAPSQCLPVSLKEDPRVKTQFSWSRTFTPLHAHVQPGPLPSQVQLPVGPTPTRQSRQQPRGYETGGIAKPGHLPSNSPESSSLWCTCAPAGREESGTRCQGSRFRPAEPKRWTESARTTADRLRLPWHRGGTKGC